MIISSLQEKLESAVNEKDQSVKEADRYL